MSESSLNLPIIHIPNEWKNLLIGGLVCVGVGYYLGSRKDDLPVNNKYPKNTFFLSVQKQKSSFDSVFSEPQVNIYEALYEVVKKVPEEETINIVVKTHGGPLYWTEKITKVFMERSGKVRVFVKDYAHSAGSVLALAADEVYMNKFATMSAIDPQVNILGFFSYLPLAKLGSFISNKENLSNFLNSQSDQDKSVIRNIVKEKHPDNVDEIMTALYDNIVYHGTLFTRTEMEELGINIIDWDGETISEEDIVDDVDDDVDESDKDDDDVVTKNSDMLKFD
jgi:ATP-dependent protease ClpP protease subunit